VAVAPDHRRSSGRRFIEIELAVAVVGGASARPCLFLAFGSVAALSRFVLLGVRRPRSACWSASSSRC